MGIRKRATRKRAASTISASEAARTIVYIHGIGNKPVEPVLRCQWDSALMGFGLGERSRMAYWCQADRHGAPAGGTCATGDLSTARNGAGGTFGARADGRVETLDDIVHSTAHDPDEEASLRRLLAELQPATAPARARAARRTRAARVEAAGLDDINVPDFITRFVTGLFIRDVRDFFFDNDRRRAMKDRLRERLASGNGPFVIVAHSQGTMIAWSLLQELDPTRFRIPLLVTIGSPLGLAEVRGHLRRIHKLPARGTLPTPPCVGAWYNFLDPRDVVTQGTGVIDFYGGAANPQDFTVVNPDRGRDPHSATGYLSLPNVRQAVRDHVDLPRFQRLAPFTLAADAVRDFEQASPEVRRPLLIELTDPSWAQSRAALLSKESKRGKRDLPQDRKEITEAVVKLIREVVPPRVSEEDLEIQRLTRFVSARLTRTEAERLASSEAAERLGFTVAPLYRVWRNARKVALLDKSTHAVHAHPAHQSYGALGAGIRWAVLDSGCTPHVHFRKHSSIAAKWDCTQLSDQPLPDGTAVTRGRGKRATASTRDVYGHGTHVSGIIAGEYETVRRRDRVTIAGIAPRARLHVYKVLNDEGEGDDAWIIKALDHIARINDEAGRPEIAGVNLSLGGEFEQGIFGCGHTPLCDELRRLWRQGVVVVLAAGNEGYRRLQSSDGEFGTNVPYSIGDPANLEEAIAVGAVHKEKPQLYGVSHFSSRGPTADGRAKPDCVAPGEQILSCRHNPRAGATALGDLYYKLDGTSMAAPHVSGLIACFLSLRREYIGYPDKVKKILLESCADLGRDRSLQGAGMPNLVKMLVQT